MPNTNWKLVLLERNLINEGSASHYTFGKDSHILQVEMVVLIPYLE